MVACNAKHNLLLPSRCQDFLLHSWCPLLCCLNAQLGRALEHVGPAETRLSSGWIWSPAKETNPRIPQEGLGSKTRPWLRSQKSRHSELRSSAVFLCFPMVSIFSLRCLVSLYGFPVVSAMFAQTCGLPVVCPRFPHGSQPRNGTPNPCAGAHTGRAQAPASRGEFGDRFQSRHIPPKWENMSKSVFPLFH